MEIVFAKVEIVNPCGMKFKELAKELEPEIYKMFQEALYVT